MSETWVQLLYLYQVSGEDVDIAALYWGLLDGSVRCSQSRNREEQPASGPCKQDPRQYPVTA